MSSNASAADETTNSTTTQVLDKRAVLERGNQLIDNVFYSNDDKVIRAAMAENRAMLQSMANGSQVTIATMLKALERALQFVDKGQVQASAFALKALEGARADLQAMQAQGADIIKLSDKTTGQAMSMAERVALDQAKNQQIALEIVADAKTGDFTELTKSLAGMMMVFVLAGLYLVKRVEK